MLGLNMSNPVPSERLALAYRLLAAIRYDSFRSNMEASMPQGASLLFAGVDQADVRRLAAEAWATHLNEEELARLIDFFESPAGQKYLDTLPRVTEAVKPALTA